LGKALSKKILITASIVLAGFLFSIWLATSPIGAFLQPSNDLFAKCRSTQIVGGAGTIGGPFSLINQDGETVSDKDVITEPSLIYFGYTFCPDVCPLDGARNAEAVDMLAQQSISATPIFISIDPKRDTPEVVAEFTKWLHPKMIGLTGTAEQVKAVSKAYRTYYKLHDKEDKDFYLVDHSTMTYLMLPEHGFVEFFRRDESANTIAEKAACFISRS